MKKLAILMAALTGIGVIIITHPVSWRGSDMDGQKVISDQQQNKTSSYIESNTTYPDNYLQIPYRYYPLNGSSACGCCGVTNESVG